MARYNNNSDSPGLIIFGIMLLIPAIVLGCVRITIGIGFSQNVSGRLKRAADANSIELAKTELGAALAGMETQGCTEGRSHMLWYTPDCDITFWHDNIAGALAELRAFPTDADSLTTSNQLMKLRETLLDDGQEVSVTLPPNVVVYPNQGLWLIGGMLAFISCIIGFGMCAVATHS